ncbi:MAG: RHS repeat-associated core domain-containing protein [Bacteroidia bacterium]
MFFSPTYRLHNSKNEANKFATPDSYRDGMQINSRSVTLTGKGYRYGFNGMEKDDEFKGECNSIEFAFRIYDCRLGKFLSIDPLFSSYPFYTPYQFAANQPIHAVDLEGLESSSDKSPTTATHTVESGETLSSIAKKYSTEDFIVTPKMIMEANDLDWGSEKRHGNQVGLCGRVLEYSCFF